MNRAAFALLLGLAAAFGGAIYLVLKAKDAACAVVAPARYCGEEKKP